MAVKAGKRTVRPGKDVRLDPFDIVSHTRMERHGDLTLHHEHPEPREWANDPRVFLFDTSLRTQQLPLLAIEAKTSAESFTPMVLDASGPLAGVFPAYLTSMLVMFVQSTATPESHPWAVEGRLKRLERVVLASEGHAVEVKPQVDWGELEAALIKAADALGWQVKWTIDRERSELLGQVAGLDYGQLARQKLDFYEKIASAVDKETFKAVAFDLEPAE